MLAVAILCMSSIRLQISTCVSLRYARLGLGKAMLHTKRMLTSTCGGFHDVSPVSLEMMKTERTDVLKK